MKCPLCGAAASQSHENKGRSVFRCPECDLAFLPPKCRPTDEEARREYLRHDNTMECEGYVRMFEEKIDLLERHAGGVRTVLDYGCGPGPVLVELLNRRGYCAYGYDLLFFPDADLDRFYDCVFSTEAFEHFAEPRRELERIGGLLRPGGVLAVMTLLHRPGTDFESWWYLNVPSHIALYSDRTFRWIERSCGYERVYSDGERFMILRKRVEGSAV